MLFKTSKMRRISKECKIMKYLKSAKVICFLSGIAAALVGVKMVKSKTVRKACVATMAKGMKLQKDAQEAFQNMKEEAEDLCFEAQKKAGLAEDEEASQEEKASEV